jgi:hypothetical protein
LAAHHGPAFQNLLLKTGESIPAGMVSQAVGRKRAR